MLSDEEREIVEILRVRSSMASTDKNSWSGYSEIIPRKDVSNSMACMLLLIKFSVDKRKLVWVFHSVL